MNISELAPELQELCFKRQREQGNSGTFVGSVSGDKGQNNFNWKNTPEGRQFWSDVEEGLNVTSSKHYPKRELIYQIY